MSLIEHFVPSWRMRQVDRVAVAAEPSRALAAVRAFDLYRVPLARGLRELARTAGLAQITAPGTGFHLLGDDGRELVVGSIGRFWEPTITFAEVTPETFAARDEPGWGKLAWSLAVARRESGGSWITIDLRVDADAGSWTQLARRWRLIGPFSHAMRRGALRRFRRELGAVIGDRRRALAGDDLLPSARAQLTHAHDIEAPPASVWPWLVQMGRRRAGWYSWDRLDNGGRPSADRIIPELQELAVGDVLPWRDEGPEGFWVKRIDPGRALVLGSKADYFDGTWSFVLEPIGDGATHLVTRYRAAYRLGPRMLAVRSIMGPLHAFMERKQLATIKARAEGLTGTSPRGRPARAARPRGSPGWHSAPRRTLPPRRGGAARPRAR